MTVIQLLALHQPHSDIATHRQVFYCPQCGARLLGPDPAEKRPVWIIPLLCCMHERKGASWDLEHPLLEPGYAIPLTQELELRRRVVWTRRTGRRIILWLPSTPLLEA